MVRTLGGWALLLGMSVALTAAGWVGFEAVRHVGSDALALRAFNDGTARSQADLNAIREAIVGGLAQFDRRPTPTGQANLVLELRTDVSALRQFSSDGEGLNSVEAAAAALEGLPGFNRLGQDGLELNQAALRASLDSVTAASARIEEARQAEESGAARRRSSRLDQLTYAGGGAGLVALTGLVLAHRLGRRPPRSKRSESATETPNPSRPAPAFESRPQEADTGAAATATAPAMAPSVVLDRPGADFAENQDLPLLSALCTDFARLRDSVELPGLLERSAHAIGASGFIVWIGNREQTQLRAALAHGYSAHALGRLPAISRGDDNATASAWREGSTRVVRADGHTPGAIVVPLLTPTGCAGVLSAEIHPGLETRAAVAATAAIVAALISTVVAVPSDASGLHSASEPPARLAL